MRKTTTVTQTTTFEDEEFVRLRVLIVNGFYANVSPCQTCSVMLHDGSCEAGLEDVCENDVAWKELGIEAKRLRGRAAPQIACLNSSRRVIRTPPQL